MGVGFTGTPVQAIVALRLLVRTERIRGALIVSNKAVLPQWKKHLDNRARVLRRGNPELATNARISLFSAARTRAYLPFIPYPVQPFFKNMYL